MGHVLGRRDLLGACLALAMPGLAGPARAQAPSWPARPIRLIVPFAPGGSTDVSAREIAQRLTEVAGWTVVVENRPGAGGNIGMDLVAKATPDGYTIGMGQTANLAINPSLYPSMPFDPLRDLAPVTTIAQQPNLLVVRRAATWRDMPSLVNDARARPGRVSVGHPGVGTGGHLAGEMLAAEARVDMLMVPYPGVPQALADLLGGRVDLFFANPLAVQGMLQSGELRALAVTSLRRMSNLPEVPTVAELGYPGFEALNWVGVVAPASTPSQIVLTLNERIRQVLRHPATVAKLGTDGSELMGSTPDEFATFLRSEIDKWGRVIRAARISIN
jgi:tripartite-type tricarboxylate transporter receptor subunit TctC